MPTHRKPILQSQPVRVKASATPGSVAGTFVIGAIVVAALYFGRDILVPFALAVLLTFALAPLVIRLGRWGIGRITAVTLVVTLTFAVIGGFGTIVTLQLIDLTDNLTTYRRNLVAKIQSFGGAAPAGGIVERATELVEDVNKELEAATQQAEGADGQLAARGGEAVVEPIPVEVIEPHASPLEILTDVSGPLLAPIATIGIVIVFVIFMLLQREDLRDRLIRLVGSGDIHLTTTAMDDAAKRISRYLLMQLILNVLYGIPIGLGLWLIGIPNPVLWGMLATVLRFIPYVGPVLAAAFPIALSVAVDRGWDLAVLTIALFVVAEVISSNVVEPWLYGASTGLSPMAIIAAAIFWTALWGPIGLLLAMPLSVCLVVLGRHVPHLQFLDIMLGNEPVLPAPVKFYQRMLAHDPDEAIRVAEDFPEENPLIDFYDRIVLPALSLADRDRRRGSLDSEAEQVLVDEMNEVIDALAEEDEAPGRPLAASRPAAVPDAVRRPRVVCVGARNRLDEVGAAMLARLLQRQGAEVAILGSDAVVPRTLSAIDHEGVDLVCLSYVDPTALQHARRLVRRLRAYFQGAAVMTCLWNVEPQEGASAEARNVTGADLVGLSLHQAVEHAHEALALPRPPEAAPTEPEGAAPQAA